MNRGEAATRLGLPGIPTEAESIMLDRDLRLAQLTGGRYHAAQLSTAESLAAWLQQQTRESLADMAARARALAKPDAADQVASICAAVAGASPGGKQ